MQPYNRLFQVTLFLSILAILAITYATIFINNFKTPEATDNFFVQSNTYSYIAQIVKVRIQNKYPQSLRTNVIQLTVANTALNYIISPTLIQRLVLPLLQVRQKVAQLPLFLAENNVVFDTKPYTDNINSTLNTLNLPSAVMDAAQKVISTIPRQITVVDTKQHPNSILASIIQARTFFENIQTLLTISWTVLILCLVALLLINMKLIRRLIYGLQWISGVCAIVLLILSIIIPFLGSLSQNPDPIVGLLRDYMIQSMVGYYFSLTRNVGFVFLVFAILLFILYKYTPLENAQAWIDKHILPQPKPTTPAKKKTK